MSARALPHRLRLRPPLGESLIAGAILTVLTWPFTDVVPQAGLDPSWRVGLGMAADRGLAFGRDVVFTYGPLGHLTSPTLTSPDSFRVALLFQLVLQIAAAGVLFAALRRTFSIGLAAVIAYVALALLAEDPAIVLAAAAALLVVHARAELSRAAVAALGVLAGVELLCKLNIGVAIFVVLLLALLSRPGRRRAPIALYLGVAAATLLVCWLVAGQPLGALPDYLRHGASVTAGYSAAMSLYDHDLIWTIFLGAVIACLLAYGAWTTTWQLPTRARVWSMLALAFLTFVLFKDGFVRLDTHVQLYFSVLLPVIAALAWGESRRREGALATLAAGVALVAVLGAGQSTFTAPTSSASGLVDALRLAVDSGHRDAKLTEARQRMTRAYAIEPDILAKLGHASVSVQPKEIAAAFAYGMNWHPLPVFQDYQAYTSDLDDLNADELASAGGPEKVLRNLDGSIDNRLDAWDPPREKFELLCHFRQEAASARWQLLTRVPDRCGPEHKLAEVRATLGATIKVPSPGAGNVLLARVDGLGPGGLEAIRALLYKPAYRYAILNGNQFVRVIPATAGDGLLISIPPELDFPGPFHLAPNPSTMTFTIGLGAQDASHEVTVSFYAVPVQAV